MDKVTTTTAPQRGAKVIRRQAAIAVIITAIVFFVRLLFEVQAGHALKSDFTVFYTGGVMVRRGETAQLYHTDAQSRVQAQLHTGAALVPFDHPAFEALIAVVFATLSYSKAYLLWGGVSIVALFLTAWLLAPWSRTANQPFLYMLVVFAFYPVWVGLLAGQASSLLLLFFALAYINLQKNRDIRAGLWLALGLVRFQIVLPFALLLLLKRKWKVIAGFSVGGAILSLISLLMIGWAGLRSYARLLTYLLRHPQDPHYVGILTGDMPNLRGIFSALLPHWAFSPVLLLFSVILIAATTWARRDGHFDYSLAIPVSLLVAPHLHVYDVSLMVLAIILALNSAPEMTPRWRNVMYASAAALYLPPLYLALQPVGGLYLISLLVAAFTLASICGARADAVSQPRPGSCRLAADALEACAVALGPSEMTAVRDSKRS